MRIDLGNQPLGCAEDANGFKTKNTFKSTGYINNDPFQIFYMKLLKSISR